jgi:DNA-binding transcriptional regulator PaaX
MEIIDGLEAQGHFCFSFAEMVEKLDASPVAIRSALNRLKKKGVLALGAGRATRYVLRSRSKS